MIKYTDYELLGSAGSTRAVPINMAPLLFKGGAKLSNKIALKNIKLGHCGNEIPQRVPIVRKITELFNERVAIGYSRDSVRSAAVQIREFFKWVDDSDFEINANNIDVCFLSWTRHINHRQEIQKNITAIHAYQSAVSISKTLSQALELDINLLKSAGITRPKKHLNEITRTSDKQNLQSTFQFGYFLCDITTNLDAATITKEMPIIFLFRTGKKYEEWLKLRPPETLTTLNGSKKPSIIKGTLEKREKWASDTSMRTRAPLIYLRVEAELLIFIAQTGMNLT